MNYSVVILLLVAKLIPAQYNYRPQSPPAFQGAVFGNCDAFSSDTLLPDLIPLQRQAERQSTASLSVQIIYSKITCAAFGTKVAKFSSVTVAVIHTCSGSSTICGSSNFPSGRYKGLYSFKCGVDNTWTIYAEDEDEFRIANRNPDFSTLQQAQQWPVSPPGSCTACFFASRANEDRRGVRNSTTGCLECPPTCLQSPSEGCVPSSSFSSDACAQVAYNGEWVSSCLLPDFAPLRSTIFTTVVCLERVMLSLVDQGNDPLCVGDSVVFNCSMSPSRFQGITTFSWRVTHPNLDTVHLSLGGGVDTLAVEELGGAIFAWTSKYETDRYFESYLTITHQTNISIGLYNVECILHGYGSATASAATNNTFFVPNRPANFSVVSQERNVLNSLVELQWVLDVPSVLYAPDSVTLLVSPNPILQPVGAAVSPTMLTLTHDTEYTATLVLTNCAGTNTSTIEFRTGILPTSITVVDLETSDSSTAILSRSLLYGTVGQTFLCSVSASFEFTAAWAVNQSSGNILTSSNSQGALLTWLRPMDLSDSGQYLCNVMVSGKVTNSVGVNINVRYPPVLTSLAPTYPVYAAFSDILFVPEGYVGTLVTCAGSGLPPWRIEWNSNGLPLDNQKYSYVVEQVDRIHFSARLVLHLEFTVADNENFSCVLRIDEFSQPVIWTVALRARLGSVSPSIACAVNYGARYFMIRILNAPNCESWDEEQRIRIATDFELALRSAIGSVCTDCTLTNSTISITSLPVCSIARANAVAFWGSIVSHDFNERKRIMCAIYSWQRSTAEIRLHEDMPFSRVDDSCPIELSSSTSSGCEVSSGYILLIFQSTAVVGAPLVGIMIVALYAGIVVLHCRNNWRKRSRESNRVNAHKAILSYEGADVKYQTGLSATASMAGMRKTGTPGPAVVPASKSHASAKSHKSHHNKPHGTKSERAHSKESRSSHNIKSGKSQSTKSIRSSRSPTPSSRSLKVSKSASSHSKASRSSKHVKSSRPHSERGAGRSLSPSPQNLLTPASLGLQLNKARKPASYHSEFAPKSKLHSPKPQHKPASHAGGFRPSSHQSSPQLTRHAKHSKRPASSNSSSD